MVGEEWFVLRHGGKPSIYGGSTGSTARVALTGLGHIRFGDRKLDTHLSLAGAGAGLRGKTRRDCSCFSDGSANDEDDEEDK